MPGTSSTPQVNDLLGGTVLFSFTQPAAALPQIPSARLSALAITGAARVQQVFQQQTQAEGGRQARVVRARGHARARAAVDA